MVVALLATLRNNADDPKPIDSPTLSESIDSTEDHRAPERSIQGYAIRNPTPVPRNWEESISITQTETPVSGNPYLRIRSRIVRDTGFEQPVLLEETIVEDPSNNEALVELRKSMIANQLIISSLQPLERERIETALENSDWTLARLIGGGHTAVLQSSELELDTVEKGIVVLQERFAAIEDLRLEPNTIFYASLTVPNDEHYEEAGMWGLDNSEDHDIDAPEGWDEMRDATGVAIAIIDTGIRLDHEDLIDNLWRNPGEIPDNDVDDDNNGYVDDVFGVNTVKPSLPPDDDAGHGTHVAGIVGAVGDNERGVVGVAWAAELMAIKFMNASGRGSLDDAVEAIDYAVDNGAKVINASWGAPVESPSLELAMSRANSNGVFIVAAAGNENANIDRVFHHPASTDLPNVITVASATQSGHLSPFSNYGIGKTDLIAPGSDILSTWADSADAYSLSSGTSMAAPYVSGILALNIALRPENDMQLHIDRLIFTSKKRPGLLGVARSQGIASLASSLALETVPYPPVIESHSELTLFRAAGDTVELSAEVSSDLPVTFEWQLDGSPLGGESASTLLLESVSEADEGTYTFTATNDDGEASIDFELTVLTHIPSLADGLDAAPSVSILPERDDLWSIGFDSESRDGDHIEGAVPAAGGSNNLRAVIQGPGLLRFFWKLEGVSEDIPRPELQANGRYLRLRESSGQWSLGIIELEEDKAYDLLWRLYGADLTGGGDAKLIIDHLQIHPQGELPPLIYRHPEGYTAKPFQDIRLSVAASGDDLTYDWYKDGELLFSIIDRRLSLDDVTTGDEGAYHAVVSNAYGTDTSLPAVIDVDENQTPVHFNEWTKDVKGVRGERLDLTLDHGGSPDITYKWYKNHYELPGENGPTLSLNPLRMEHAGNYEMEISNAHGPTQRSNGIWVQVVDQDLSPAALLGDRDPYTIESFEGDTIEYDYYIATEFLPVQFQWYRNGLPVEGQTNRLLKIENATFDDSGDYFLEFKNERGSFRGSILSLVVHFDAGEALDYTDVTWEVRGQEDRGWSYPQREVSFDGEDAFEFARRYEFDRPSQWDDGGFTEFLGAYFTGPINLSVYWKRTSVESWFEAYVGNYPRDFSAADRVATFSESGEVGDWQRSVIHVPEGERFVSFRFVGANPDEKGWLDKVEITDAPTVVSDVPGRIIVGDNGITVNAQASGAGTIAYQWFKNGDPLPGQTTATLDVGANDFAETDRFFLSASSEFGETTSGSFQLTPVKDLIDARGRDFNFGGDSYWERNPWENSSSSFMITLKPEESAWMEFEVEGPAIVSWAGGDPTVFLDGSLTSTIEWIGLYDLRYDGINVPSGVHTVRLSYGSQPNDSASRTKYLADLQIQSAPLIVSKDPLTTEAAAEYRQNTAVYFAGFFPITVRWYKDGQLARESTVTSGSQSSFFEDWDTPRDPSHAGTYYCEITDANGDSSRSEDFVIREIDTRELGSVIGDEGLYYCDGYFPVLYDTENFVEGEASAFFTIPSGWRNGDITLCSENQTQETYPAFELSVRISGYDDETIVQIVNGADSQALELTDEWQTIRLTGNADILRLHAEKSQFSELTIWFDGVSRDYGLRIVDEPKHFATYLNGSASFSVEAFSDTSISYQWRRDGVDLPGATSENLEIENVGRNDLGDYDVVVSSDGESLVSNTVSLTIAEDLGAAIEYPGLRIRTWGDALWEIDEIISIDGTKSLKSGDIGVGESSHIEIEFDYPGMYSIYYNYQQSNDEKQTWEITNDISADTPFKIDFHVSLEDGLQGNDFTPTIRLDRLSFSALASQSYEEWLDESASLASNPNEENSLFDENADADGDRISNFLEYLFDLDPFGPSQLPQINIQSLGDQIRAEMSYRFAANGESTVKFEVSSDLENWELLSPENIQWLEEGSKYYNIQSSAVIPVSETGVTFVRWTTSRTESSTAPIEVNSTANPRE